MDASSLQPPTAPNMMPAGALMVNRDLEHLKVLSICWYVIAGLNAVGGCFGVLYVILGVIFMNLPPDSTTQPGQQGPPPEAMGGMFMGMGGCIMILALGVAVLAFLTARWLKQQRNRTFCMFVAGLMCLSVPIGTVLGVFTLIVLSRASVQLLFARNASTARLA